MPAPPVRAATRPRAAPGKARTSTPTAPEHAALDCYRREVGPDDPIDGIRARDWAAFVGRSPMYYLMQFFPHERDKRRISFSFAAFFFGPAYLLYRKMWKEGVVDRGPHHAAGRPGA